MKIFPEDRKKKIGYIVFLVIAVLALIYILFLRGEPAIETESILTNPTDQTGGVGAPLLNQSLQSRLLPYGTNIDSRVFDDELFQLLRPAPDLTVSGAELGNSNPFSISP